MTFETTKLKIELIIVNLGISRHAPPQPRGRDMPQVSSDVGDHPNNRVIRDMALLNGGAYRKLLP